MIRHYRKAIKFARDKAVAHVDQQRPLAAPVRTTIVHASRPQDIGVVNQVDLFVLNSGCKVSRKLLAFGICEMVCALWVEGLPRDTRDCVMILRRSISAADAQRLCGSQCGSFIIVAHFFLSNLS
jgi:hypothetical protein